MMPRAVALAAVVVALAAGARATTFVAMDDRTLARAADAIVVGTIDRLESVSGRDGAISTLVTVRVDEALKGHVPGHVVLRQPGGRVGERGFWVAGSPEFRVGERDLLFLSAHRDGTARTTALGMGQYRLSADAGTGETFAERTLREPVLGGRRHRRLALATLRDTIRHTLASDPAAAVAPIVATPDELTQPGLERTNVDAFALMDAPHGRWREPDAGERVVFHVDPAGDAGLGPDASNTAVDGALAAWTNVSGATIALERGTPVEAAPLFCDGVSQIVFNDPFDEMPKPASCSGILALGGYCTSTRSSDRDVVGGVTYVRITEGNITFNNGFANCSFWNLANLAEVTTHEVGHTLGIGHSSEDDDEPSAVLKEATMYYRAHFDGRGASLKADDLAAVRAVYPGESTVTNEDQDGDGIVDTQDNCPGDVPSLGIANAAQTDSDGDGIGDLCDPCPLVAGAPDTAACNTIYGSRLRGRTRRGRSRLVWRASIDLPEGTGAANARALLVNGLGIVVDTEMASALRQGPQLTYRGDGAVIKLKRGRWGSYQVRVAVRGVTLASDGAPLVSASLSVGDRSFATSLACRDVRAGRVSCD